MGSVAIESRNVGRIIGPKGATIRQLQSDYNVSINISKEDDMNGNRVAEITGSSDDVQRAMQGIQERFGCGGGGGYRAYDGNQQQSFRERNVSSYEPRGRNQSYGSRDIDFDSTPNNPSAFITHVPMTHSAIDDDDWDNAEMQSSYQPSANTYQRSDQPSTFDPPQRYNRNEDSYGGDRRGAFRGGFRGSFNSGGSGSSYSSGNKIPYRDEPTSQMDSPAEPKEYEVIDWAAANIEAAAARKARWEKCPVMVKDFYVEDQEVTNMTDEDVDKFRLENKNIQVSRTFSKEGEESKPMPKPTTKFEHAFKAFPDLMGEIKKAGFDKPSPIQSQMWPILLAGKDCIGIAQTGTGKTLAFLLPAMIHTDGQPHPRGIKARGGPNVLVLAPTRELAIQIEKEVAKYQFRGIKAVCLYGGNDRNKQIAAVESGVEIIIATPGRLNDLVAAGFVKIESITYLVLDEADRMLDMGFEPQIRKLLLDIRDDRVTVMTSATWPAGVRRLASSYMNDPYQVFVGSLDLAATHTVTQVIEIMDEEEKYDRVIRFAKSMKPTDKAIIFCGRKDRADSLSCDFVLAGINCTSIHGNREQSDREQALADIKSGEVPILIATDVASRGIDIEDITYVVNYDFPRNIEEYVHRVGRTGRANKTGISLSFMTRSDWGSAAELIEILKEAEQEIPEELENMAARFKAKKERERLEGGSSRGFRGGNRGGGGGGRGGNRSSNRW